MKWLPHTGAFEQHLESRTLALHRDAARAVLSNAMVILQRRQLRAAGSQEMKARDNEPHLLLLIDDLASAKGHAVLSLIASMGRDAGASGIVLAT